MIGRKLSSAAKQLLSSSSTHASLFHTSNTPEQAVKIGRVSAQRKSFASRTSNRIAAAAPPATRKAPPLGLAGELEKLNLPKRKDCDDDTRPPRRSWRPPSHAKVDIEDEKKKKKKKRAPPGPIEFESLTAPTPAHSDLPFAFRYSYTEIPKAPAVGFQEKFSPFGPGRLDRVWDGQQAVSSPSLSSLLSPSFSSWRSPSLSSSTPSDNSVLNMRKGKYSFKGVRLINPSTSQQSHTRSRRVRSREEVLGEPLTQEEIKVFVENASKHKTRRQINMGRDGLTHNMLIEIQEHWKREPVIRIRCKGVCTVDMDNIVFQLEDKTGGKIIERIGGTLYLFRGRNFKFKDRPFIPPMLWKPHAPMYPKLISEAPGGLKVYQANVLRKRGLQIMRLCILSKNAYYGDLVRHVREAFEDDELVRIDCKGLNPSDYKKIGSKLRDLVPCYLLSFDKEQIILWRGRDWVSSRVESKPSKVDSNNFKESDGTIVQHLEDGGKDIQMLVGQSGDVNSIKSCCDFSNEAGNLWDTSDEDAESSGFSSSESESSASLEESIEA
ncbi:hypothetical protein GOP47_0009261 [Adiantum capillus-veneris]|uniref:CRM domain-containing protein n=1 Tax=Adiantum capillus-veneris TaxID=13818 RepID=A0A9D4UWP1_ADICA|nr:hypothetical protein GOP47_0009261 [Adiantum capillus-veneris]